ncbi:MAG: AAA family ATPase [Bacteroides sp.]|nr:AAA family ATPase [Bacteroides sp.]
MNSEPSYNLDLDESLFYTSVASDPEAAPYASSGKGCPGAGSQLEPADAARKIVEETGVNLFLTGKAGTGKTTFLRRLTERARKRIVVLAPTGVAAINAGGITIHSFFQLDFAPFIPGVSTATSASGNRFSRQKISVIRSMDLLVIDEISMVRPDVLDAMDAVLRRFRNPVRPFGGVQLLLIGDLRQLAPVAQEQEWQLLSQHYASPYFFESHALRQAGFMMIELTKVYRQSDQRFISILNSIRDNTADHDVLADLNRRAHPGLMPPDGADEGYIRLTTHNYRADSINARRIEAINSPAHIFSCEVTGTFPRSAYPADESLLLKDGAQVMFIKNDPSGNRLYYNGLIGTIVSLSDSEIVVRPRPSAETGRQGPDIKVGKVAWDNIRYELLDSGELKEIVEGRFCQIPLRLAWAITIHKSQGLTFDKAIVDAAHSFAPGQTYVALSRCRSLEGLVLDSPLPPYAIMTDPAVNRFVEGQPRFSATEHQLDDFRRAYYFDLLMELFSFRSLDNAFDSYYRACAASLPRIFPRFMEAIDTCREIMLTKITDVSVKTLTFLNQGRMKMALISRAPDPESKKEAERKKILELIEMKVKGGANYFTQYLSDMARAVEGTPLNLDNKTLQKRLRDSLRSLREILEHKLNLCRYFADKTFDPDEYLRIKTMEIAREVNVSSPASKRRSRVAAETPDSNIAGKSRAASSSSNISPGSLSDIENPSLYKSLAGWRKEKAAEMDVPAYRILSNRSLIEIARELPENTYDLLGIKGLGSTKVRAFGREIIEVIESWHRDNS